MGEHFPTKTPNPHQVPSRVRPPPWSAEQGLSYSLVWAGRGWKICNIISTTNGRKTSQLYKSINFKKKRKAVKSGPVGREADRSPASAGVQSGCQAGPLLMQALQAVWPEATAGGQPWQRQPWNSCHD